MTRIISVSNNKGGCLKSSIVTHLAAVFAKEKKRVLIVDTDNQGDAALSFGKSPDDYTYTIYDVLVDNLPVERAIYSIYKNIDLLPANDEFQFFDFDILTNIEKYENPFGLLTESLKSVENDYDYILIDTPPNLGLTQGNVLSYTKEVLIPFQPEGYSMRSLVKILNAIHSFKENRNPELEILGVVATLVDYRTVLHSDIMKKANQYCYENQIAMFETEIPRTIRYAAGVAYGGRPSLLKAKSPKNEPYYELAAEIKRKGK